MDFQTWLRSESGAEPAVQEALDALARIGIGLSARISMGDLEGALASEVGANADGDTQKALDVIADDEFAAELKNTQVRWYASEEQEEVAELNPVGGLALAIDPLDGSSNIDVNVSIGTIFSIYDAKDDGEASFLRPGKEQLAAGYIVYGPQTSLTLSTGNGVQIFTLDRSKGVFLKSPAAPLIPVWHKEYAINSSNRRHWEKPLRAFIEDCERGESGPHGRDSNMRWVASLVAEAHRILMRGGVFLYPGDSRNGYSNGRLRHVYECSPIAFLIEQAGGLATNCIEPLLEQTPASLHARIPLVFGSRERVLRLATYYDLPENEVSPLFGQRGLFSGA